MRPHRERSGGPSLPREVERNGRSRLGARTVCGLFLIGGWVMVGCSGGSEADQLGIAAICSEDADCAEVVVDGEEVQLSCITDLKDGYCSIPGCDSDLDCPTSATCVAYTDGNSYCFRECSAKDECNVNRTPNSEANCSSNFDYADPNDDIENKKVCMPPSN